MKLPNSNKLPIEKLSACFTDTTNAYKFYWFLSILDHLLEKEELHIPLKELAIRMIASAWYPLDYYKLSFGKQDGFKKIAISISNKIVVDNSPNAKTLFEQIYQRMNPEEINILHKEVFLLLRWVPYRFLRPFFKNQLIGLKDHKINKRIIELANSGIDMNRCPYYFGKEEIIITQDWFNYFQTNQNILRSFIKWHLVKFLQKNNPNVIGLSEKLEKPIVRNMKLAKIFWKKFISSVNTKCIYSNVMLSNKSMSLDHFLPWTFIAHDQIWNIIPTIRSVNSSKNNWLPSLDKYLDVFLQLQFNAMSFHLKNNNLNLVEDYLLFFGVSVEELIGLSYSEFELNFKKQFFPLFETARNLGFSYPFIYKNK